ARQDDRLRSATLDLGPRRVMGQELGVDVQLAHAPGDELGELAAEVEDDDRRWPPRHGWSCRAGASAGLRGCRARTDGWRRDWLAQRARRTRSGRTGRRQPPDRPGRWSPRRSIAALRRARP